MVGNTVVLDMRRSSSDLFKALDRCAIGDIVDLEVLRENGKQHVMITLGSST